MPSTRFESAVRRQVERVNRSIAEDIVRLREDAGLSRLRVSRTAGISDACLGRIEDGSAHPSAETLIRIGLVLGADVRTRLYPNTGPLIRDRHQARMLEALLRDLDTRWRPYTEVAVRSPGRGWIDAALHDPGQRVLVATELQADLRRIEQTVRWSDEKAASLPSWEGWPHLGEPRTSKALIVRRTRTTRATVREFGRQLRLAYPAHPDDALASLWGTAGWPGSALVWALIEGERTRLVGGR